ncbi:MAG: hypothetical protein PHR45_05020 [Muribaculaceae bacterium]|nr:hypothetical protein [Muribaculaceae bacterium]
MKTKSYIILMFIIIASPLLSLAENKLESVPCSDLPSVSEYCEETDQTTFDKDNFGVTIQNNDEGIFVSIEIMGDSLKRKMINEGASVYIDITGKKKEKCAVEFSNYRSKEPRRRGQKEDKAPQILDEEKIKSIVDELGYEPITLRIDKDEYLLAENEASIDYKDSKIIYNIAIKYARLNEQLNKKGKISIGIANTKRKAKAENKEMGEMMPPPDRQGDNRPGGNRPGGFGEHKGFGENGKQLTAPKDYKQWINVELK